MGIFFFPTNIILLLQVFKEHSHFKNFKEVPACKESSVR